MATRVASAVAAPAAMAVVLTRDHGAAVLAYVLGLTVCWMYATTQVSMARKRLNVPYPNLYAPTGHKHEKEFNCIQRGHQNTVESLAVFTPLFFLTAIAHPRVAAVAAVFYFIGRTLYARGYAKGSPDGRHEGSIYGIGLVTCLVVAFKFSINLLLPGFGSSLSALGKYLPFGHLGP